MVIASFQIFDKLDQTCFFQKTFLLANISAKVVLGMFFLALSNISIKFAAQKLTQRSYTTAKALPMIKQVEFINKKEFTKAAQDKQLEIFVVHVAALEVLPKSAKMTIHPSQIAQLLGDNCMQIAALQQDQAFTKVSAKYTDYINIFLFNLATELPENTSINKHVINLVKGKQLPYRLIYSLGLIELKTLKTYIKTSFKTRFI